MIYLTVGSVWLGFLFLFLIWNHGIAKKNKEADRIFHNYVTKKQGTHRDTRRG